MAEKKKTRKKKGSDFLDTAKQFSRFEMLFVIVLFVSFFAWAFVKCTNRQPINNVAQVEGTIDETVSEEDESVASVSPAAANNPTSPQYQLEENNIKTEQAKVVKPTVVPAAKPQVVPSENLTPLYVTLQDLKVRGEPKLNGEIITTLPLHTKVMFMDKRTDFREKINIGNGEITNEPWLYIRTKAGQLGWVYGGGVHFYKWDRLRDPIPSISDREDGN